VSLLDVPDSFSRLSTFQNNLHSMNVMYHFIFVAVDSSQSSAFRKNGKSFSCGFYSKPPPGALLKEIGLQLKQH
jgi:hypothetical protein